MSIYNVRNMQVFYFDKEDFMPKKAKIELEYKIISEQNILLIKDLMGKFYYRVFNKVLKERRSIGVAAYHKGIIVGCGWMKYQGARDFFFNLKTLPNDVAYLASFRVKESYRGNGIYPAMISWLISSKYSKGIKKFYIATSETNISSLRSFSKLQAKFLYSEKNIGL